MRNLVLALLLAFWLAGCDNGFDSTPQGLTAPTDERQVSFRFELLSRVSSQYSPKKIPAYATDIHFVGRDRDLKVLFDVTKTKDDEFVFKVKKEVSCIQVEVKAGEVPILSNLFELPDKQDVRFANPTLSPVAFVGGSGLTLDPPSVQVVPEGRVTFQSFLTAGSERLNVTEFTKLTSSDLEVLSFSDEDMPNAALGVQPGEAQVTGSFGLPRMEIIVGTATGSSQVKAVDATNAQQGSLSSFFAFPSELSQGVSVATADFNGDGVADMLVGTRSGPTRVRVIDGSELTLIHDFQPFAPEFHGGVRVAAGDVNGDGTPDIVVGAGPGGSPKVKVFDGESGSVIEEILVFDPSFIGGVNVASGDFNHDGNDDIVVGAGTGGPSIVRVFDGASGNQFKEFYAYQQQYVGGVRVAVGDVNGDGADDIITGTGPGTAPEVRVFDGRSTNPIGEFFAFQPGFSGGVFVSATDLDRDGRAEIIAGSGAEGPAALRVFKGLEGDVLVEYFAFGEEYQGGVWVAGIEQPEPRKSYKSQSKVSVLEGPGRGATPTP
jgi:VCBS repeat protein